MKKLIAAFAAGVFCQFAAAQSVLQFDVEFDTLYEASGAFLPFLLKAEPGDFNGNQPLPPSTLVGTVTLTLDPVTGQLTNASGAQNQILLNGSFSTESGNSPASGWSIHSFSDAVFDLYKPNSFLAINNVTAPSAPAAFAATTVNGALADHGPASNYSAVCPFVGGCRSSASAGTPDGTGAFILFSGTTLANFDPNETTQIYNPVGGVPVYPASWRNSGTHALLSGSATQTNPSTGLGYNNGMDVFAFQGVLDAANTLGNGAYQPYPDGVNGQPGIVRVMTMSSTGNTAYVFQGRIVPTVPAPLPAGAWLVATLAGLTLPWLRRRRPSTGNRA